MFNTVLFFKIFSKFSVSIDRRHAGIILTIPDAHSLCKKERQPAGCLPCLFEIVRALLQAT